MGTVAVANDYSRLYEQAVAHLRQQRFDLAFVAAKQALDAAAVPVRSSNSSRWQGPNGHNHSLQLLQYAKCWVALGAAAAGMGDAEVAYCLYAQGYSQLHAAAAQAAAADHVHCTNIGAQQQQLMQFVEQLAAGKLAMLAALCEAPAPQQQQQQQTHLRLPLKPQQQHASSKRWQLLQQRFYCTPSSSSSRVFCVSDLHVDAAVGANMSWVKRISSTTFRNDVLVVAGDIGDTAAAVQTAFKLLAPKFKRVVWVPGNHESWIRPGSRDKDLYPDSFSKLLALRQMADGCCVDTGPVEVQPGLVIVPLLSWYNCQFDTADPRPGHYRHDSFCSWPVSDDDVWQVMMKMNTQTITLVNRYITQQTAQHSVTGSSMPPVLLQGGLTQKQHQAQQEMLGLTGSSTAEHSSEDSNSSSNRHVGYTTITTTTTTTSSSSSSLRSSTVTWNTDGVLAVRSSMKVPGLQINLQPRSPQQRQQQEKQQLLLQEQQQQQEKQQQQQEKQQQQVGAARAVVDTPVQIAPQHVQQQPLLRQQQQQQQQPPPIYYRPPTTVCEPTIITVSHFLPHPSLPHQRVNELSKAMGCCQLQLQLEEVGSQIHVYGHSHVNTDVVLPTTPEYVPADVSVRDSKPAHPCVAANPTYGQADGSRAGAYRGPEDRSNGCTCHAVAYDAEGGSGIAPRHRRYVQYALGSVDAASAGLYCLWDGQQLTAPGCVVPIA